MPTRSEPSEAYEPPFAITLNEAPPPPAYAVKPVDTDGRLRLHDDTSSTTTVGATATVLTRRVTESSELTQTQPASGTWRQASHTSWQRDGWTVSVETGYELSADETTFFVREWLTARHGADVIYAQDETNEIPRGFM